MASMLKLCSHIGTLKHLRRTGWVHRNVDQPETIASHMYRMAVLAMALPQSPTYNIDRIIKICLIHDLAECIVGDITPHCGVSVEDKHAREAKAMVELSALLPEGVDFKSIWQEYEEHKTVEAKIAHDLDKFDMFHQAWEYERDKRGIEMGDLQCFFDNNKYVFSNETVQGWMAELVSQRSTAMNKK